MFQRSDATGADILSRKLAQAWQTAQEKLPSVVFFSYSTRSQTKAQAHELQGFVVPPAATSGRMDKSIVDPIKNALGRFLLPALADVRAHHGIVSHGRSHSDPVPP